MAGLHHRSVALRRAEVYIKVVCYTCDTSGALFGHGVILMSDTITAFKNKYHDVALTVFRVVVGLIFFLHGAQKFGVLDGTFALPGVPLMLAGGIIEVVAGLLVLLGLFTSWAAFVASGEMAVAYFMMHASSAVLPFGKTGNGGEAAILYCFAFLLLFFLGGGKWSLDAVICKPKKA